MLQSQRGPDPSCTADRAERLPGQCCSSETLFVFSLFLCPSFLAALCLPFLFYLSVSTSFHFDYSLLLYLSAPPPSFSFPFSLYFCLVPTICHLLSSSVTPSPPPSFSLPQSNSRSFIGLIRWILLSLSFWNICLPLTNFTLLMLLHKTLLCPVQEFFTVSLQWDQSTLSHQYWSQGHVFFITLLMNKQAETECYSSQASLQVWWRYECLGFRDTAWLWDGLGSDFHVYSDTMWNCPVTDLNMIMSWCNQRWQNYNLIHK